VKFLCDEAYWHGSIIDSDRGTDGDHTKGIARQQWVDSPLYMADALTEKTVGDVDKVILDC
jgi:hypothetical protein